MVDNRVQKYQEYRNSLIKKGSVEQKENQDRMTLTSTKQLPFDQVLETMHKRDDEVERIKQSLKKKYLKYSLIGMGILSFIFVVIIIAIVIFRR